MQTGVLPVHKQYYICPLATINDLIVITKKYCILIIFIFSVSLLIGQELSYEQYTVKDGLPSMKIYDVMQDSAKVLWIGTENGLASFDGDNFIKYTNPDLIDNDIIEIALNRNGRIYFVNLSGQLGYIRNDSIVIIKTHGLINKIMNVISVKDKDYLIGIKKSGGRVVFEIVESLNHTFEFVHTQIFFFHAEKGTSYSKLDDDRYISNLDSTILTSEESKGKHLTSGDDKYILNEAFILNDVVQVDETLYKYTQENYLQRIVKHKDDFYIIGPKGITHYNSKNQTYHSFLEEMKVNTIFFDSENNSWVSTPNKGLLRISNLMSKLNQVKSRRQVKKGVNDIHQDKNGQIYLGLVSSEVIINPFKESKRIIISEIQRPVRFTEYQEKVYAYSDKGIRLIDSKSSDNFRIKKIFHGPKYLLMHDSIVYYGGSSGLTIYEYNNLFNTPTKTEYERYFTGSRISYIHKSQDSKTLFIGSAKDLIQTKIDSVEKSMVELLQSINISCIIDGLDNSIWVGSKTAGIFNIKDGIVVSTLNVENGLISNNVNNLELHNEELLVSTSSGLCIINLKTSIIKIVNEYNFLPSNEVFVCKFINGEYWIGTVEGLTTLSKEDITNSITTGPFLSLKNLFVNGVKRDYVDNMELDYTVSNIQLNLQNISYKSGLKKYIKYRIPKIDSSWITTTDPSLRLPSVKPGKYHIEAIGVNAIGLQSIPLNIHFNINPPWWKTIWARILGILAILGIGNLILIYRSKRIRKEESTKREYLRQLNKIKDQALQLQMNPHFIF